MNPAPSPYPAVWNFRVIVEADAAGAVRTAVLALLAAKGLAQTITAGGSSKGGKYQTLIVPMLLHDRAEMEACAKSLTEIPGVRFLL